MGKKPLYPKVIDKPEVGSIDERCLSGPVTTYHLPPEEIEKQYGKPEPARHKFNVGWPTAGQPNERHPSRKPRDEEELFPEEEYVDPEWGLSSIKW